MPILSFKIGLPALAGAILGLGPLGAQAQSSVSSLADVGVVNASISPYIGVLNTSESDTGASVSANATPSFTGLDRNGVSQTMTFNGTVSASAQYGQLHSASSGTVTNSYFNANNPVYFNSNDNSFDPAGSPSALVSIGFASFTDTLQFGGALQAGYQARYIFHVEGTNSGYGALADLSVTIAGHNENFFAGNVGQLETDWSTQSYAIDGTNPQGIMVQFSNQFVLNAEDVADGSNVTGTSNFSDTLTLAGIEIVDASGNPVSGVTVNSDSGMAYAMVPEPASVTFLLLGAVWLLRRERRRRSVAAC